MKLFENLPSTKTPINAENLNQLQDNLVVVSATEPTGDNREKVWIQKGNNIFNKNNILVGMTINSSDGTLSTNEAYCFCGYIPVRPNTTYTRSVVGTNGNTFLDKDRNFLSSIEGTTFTTPENCYYVGFNMLTSYYTDGSYETFMVNLGKTLLEHEEYIEPKIYIKNDNNVYEEFIKKDNTKTETIWNGNLYTTGEQVTLPKSLKANNLYIFTFYGLSSNYLLQVPFTFINGYFQTTYSDGTNYFRMRLDILENGKIVRVNVDSVNNAANTALISIEKVY